MAPCKPLMMWFHSQMYQSARAAITKHHKPGNKKLSSNEKLCVSVLGTRSPKSRFWQGWFPLRALRKKSIWACNCPLPVSRQGLLLCVAVCADFSPSYEDASDTGLQVRTTPAWAYLPHQQQLNFQRSSPFQVLGVRTLTYEWGRGTQSNL